MVEVPGRSVRSTATVPLDDAGRQIVPVVYGVDNRFAVPLAAAIQSALDNLAADCWLHVHIIDGGLSTQNRQRLLRSFEGRRCRLMWLRPEGRGLSALKVGGSITVATYYRLLIPRLLPQLEKVIYLDADIIVRGDLAKLWTQPLQGRLLLAAQDQGVQTVSGEFGLSNYEALRIPKGSKYFNAGVLVFNLARWRAENTAETILRYIRDHHEHIRFHDQDGLNAILWNDWAELDPRWNQMPQILQIDAASNSPFDPETFRLARTDPYLVHYASADKPWRFGCRHPGTPQFFEYVDRTAFRGFRPTRWGTRLRDLTERIQNRARHYRKLIGG